MTQDPEPRPPVSSTNFFTLPLPAPGPLRGNPHLPPGPVQVNLPTSTPSTLWGHPSTGSPEARPTTSARVGVLTKERGRGRRPPPGTAGVGRHLSLGRKSKESRPTLRRNPVSMTRTESPGRGPFRHVRHGAKGGVREWGGEPKVPEEGDDSVRDPTSGSGRGRPVSSTFDPTWSLTELFREGLRAVASPTPQPS